MEKETTEVMIGWGRSPLEIHLPNRAKVIEAKRSTALQSVSALLERALQHPIGTPPLRILLHQHHEICLLVPDETRKDVGAELLEHLSPLFANNAVKIGIATGKHPYHSEDSDRWRHDATAPNLIDVGRTGYGTEVAYPRQVLKADLRICLGEIRPHYFAGYAGGAKTLFPGVAGEIGIWKNHTLKAIPGSRLGRVDDNPCRLDMEEAAAMAGPAFIINVIRASDGSIADIVAGDPIQAHREGVRRARPYFEISMKQRFKTVVISDRLPVTMNLYQACKLLPPAGAILESGGTVILAAECTDGIGPVETINEAIYKLGSIHSLPLRHRVILVSQHSEKLVEPTFAAYAPSIQSALQMCDSSSLAVIPYGGDLVPRVDEEEGS
jgi:lactate racemase